MSKANEKHYWENHAAIKTFGLICCINAVGDFAKVQSSFKVLFEGLGKMPDKYKIVLKDIAQSFILTAP